jgi:hypothetical protein
MLAAALAIVPMHAATDNPVSSEVPPVYEMGSRRELFVDHALISHLENTTLRLHAPVNSGMAFKIDRPWEGPGNFGHVIILGPG